MVKACKIVLPVLLFFLFANSAFAYTTTQNTYTLTSSGNLSDITFYCNSYSQIGADDLFVSDNGELVSSDISIPITMYKSGLSPASGYLNGFYKFSCNITITGSENTNFRNFNVEFLKSENPGLYLATYNQTKQSTSNSYTLRYSLYFIFHNFYWSGNYGQDITTIKVHYSDLTTNGSTFQCTIVPELSSGSGTLNHTESGITDEALATTIAEAIDNSADVDTMLQYLLAISTDTDLLNSVVSKLTDLDTKLATVLTRLQTIDINTNRSQLFLENILRALAGTSDLTTNISQETKQRWISIIQDAIRNVQPSVADNPNLRNDIESQQANNDQVEDNVYTDFDAAIQDVNLNPVMPQTIAGAIFTVNDWLTTIYTKLGALQWVIIFTCTVGIILIVLGRFRMK